MSRREKVQCARCRRRVSQQQASNNDWNMIMRQGRCVGFLCPACQSPEENAEAEINAATTSYGMDSFGRFIGRPKEEPR